MLNQIIGKKVARITFEDLESLYQSYQTVVFDLGTGDGKFAYQLAKENPTYFVIGVDADKRGIQELSHKASRKPAKGGLDNLIYIWSAVEVLPEDMANIADKVFINFPWGSLLTGVATASPIFLEKVSNLLKSTAKIEMYFSYSEKLEPQVVEVNNLIPINQDLIQYLQSEYLKFGLTLSESELFEIDGADLPNASWAKSLDRTRKRPVLKTIWTKN